MTEGRQSKSRSKLRWVLVLALLVGASATIGYLVLRGKTEVEKLVENVYLIHSTGILFPEGSNAVAVKTSDSVILIDTQLPIWTGRVQAKLVDLFGAPPSIVVNTHWHVDHSGGNDQLTDAAEIIAHENVLKLLSHPHEGFGLTGPGSHHTYEPRDEGGLPERTYDGLLTLAPMENGGLVEVVHLPNAHTDGDSVVFINDEQVVAAGDIVWPGSFPYIDVHNGGTASGLLRALDTLVARTNTKSIIVGGHQSPVSHAELTQYRNDIRATISIVRTGKQNGKSLSDLITTTLPAEYRHLSSDIVPEEAWIEMVFTTLE